MQVTVSSRDEETARQVALALVPLCDLLAPRADQGTCRISLAPGVVVCEFWAKDGTRAQVPVGVRPLAMALAVGPRALAGYAEQLCRWALRKQEEARRRRALPYGITLN